MIFISPINDVNWDLSIGGFAIFTATVETSSSLIIPTALALSWNIKFYLDSFSKDLKMMFL